MRLGVFGLGYVGSVAAACLAADGHRVIGVDSNTAKVELVNAGRSPVVESGLEDLIRSGIASGHLSATLSVEAAVLAADLSLICVGTPSSANGSLNFDYVRDVCAQIGSALRHNPAFHTIVVRSTVLPGTVRDVVIPALERASGKQLGQGFAVCFNPEFLRESTAVDDYHRPPKTVIGESAPGAGDAVAALYAGLDAPLLRTSIEAAEMVKYVDNTWHALKVGFANEIGAVCKALGIDGRGVMEIFCQDTKLNLSPYYLRPGFSFGGSCLPKDVRALRHRVRTLDLDAPILNAILPSNQAHFERGYALVARLGRRRVGVLGLSFKAGTDDLRESPMVDLIERLLGKGYSVRVYDSSVNLARLVGANKDYIVAHVPHIAELMVDSIGEVIDHAEVLVIGNSAAEFRQLVAQLPADKTVIDLVGIERDCVTDGRYEGICW